ncbi:MAG: DUF4276 family protein [Bacteroidia bacterium]|nr:DUF4276 family protein [Bacteroidia bacterium]
MIYVYVEGHGELEAVGNLLSRLSRYMTITGLQFAKPRRIHKIVTDEGIERAINLSIALGNVDGILILRDSEDNCPRVFAPRISSRIRQHLTNFPVAIVLLYREFETLFLPCISHMAGKEIAMISGRRETLIRTGASFMGDPEGRRDAKGEVSSFFIRGRYKPTLHQLPLTRNIDFEILDEVDLPCFGSLKRALIFLSSNQNVGVAYPA